MASRYPRFGYLRIAVSRILAIVAAFVALTVMMYGVGAVAAMSERYSPNCSAPEPQTRLERELKRWADHIPGECQWMSMRPGDPNTHYRYRSAMAIIWAHLHYDHGIKSFEKPGSRDITADELRAFLREAEAVHPLDHDHDGDYLTSNEALCQSVFFDGICQRVFD